MGQGLREDQVAVYKADMYVVERERATDADPKYPQIYKVIDVKSGAGNKTTQLLGAGRLKRDTTEGEDINFKKPVQGWTTYTNYDNFNAGLVFSKQAIEDTEKLGNMIKDLAGTWTDYVMIAKEELAARAFNHGGDTSGDYVFLGTFLDEVDASGLLLYDSKPLFNLTGNTRTTKGGGTYYNSTAGLAVTADNFETTYNLHTATNNKGEEDEVKTNSADTAICVPGSDEFLLRRILDTTKGLPGGQLNDKNVYFNIVDKIIAWDYLESTAGWFLGKRNDPNFCFCERQKQETDFFRDNTNKSYKASVDARFSLWFKPLAWRTFTRAGGTSVAGGATE